MTLVLYVRTYQQGVRSVLFSEYCSGSLRTYACYWYRYVSHRRLPAALMHMPHLLWFSVAQIELVTTSSILAFYILFVLCLL